MAPTRQSGPRTPRKCKESVAKTTASNGSPAKTSKSKNTLSKISRDKRPRGTSIKLSPKKAGKLAEAVAEASTAGNPVAGPVYARDLHKLISATTHPNHIDSEEEDMVQPSVEEDEDELMRQMHPESYRLAEETDRNMSEKGTEGTYGKWAENGGQFPRDGSDDGEEEYVLDRFGKVMIDLNNPEKPMAWNNVAQSKSKAKHAIDPNGRFFGRTLVPWHRPRMYEKLLLCIQFECHKSGIQLPWDKIVHRLNIGSSGPCAPQMLNKIRDVLIREGHMIPPALGKKTMKVDKRVRGYVRDMNQADPRAARILYWAEDYEHKKDSLVDTGITIGSGTYKKLAVIPPPYKGPRREFPHSLQGTSDRHNPRVRIPSGGGDIRRNKPAPKRSRAISTKKIDEDEDMSDSEESAELQPAAELDFSDMDYDPYASKKRKTDKALKTLKRLKNKRGTRTRVGRRPTRTARSTHSSAASTGRPSYIVKLPICIEEEWLPEADEEVKKERDLDSEYVDDEFPEFDEPAGQYVDEGYKNYPESDAGGDGDSEGDAEYSSPLANTQQPMLSYDSRSGLASHGSAIFHGTNEYRSGDHDMFGSMVGSNGGSSSRYDSFSTHGMGGSLPIYSNNSLMGQGNLFGQSVANPHVNTRQYAPATSTSQNNSYSAFATTYSGHTAYSSYNAGMPDAGHSDPTTLYNTYTTGNDSTYIGDDGFINYDAKDFEDYDE